MAIIGSQLIQLLPQRTSGLRIDNELEYQQTDDQRAGDTAISISAEPADFLLSATPTALSHQWA
jgi:hypothetical protein